MKKIHEKIFTEQQKLPHKKRWLKKIFAIAFSFSFFVTPINCYTKNVELSAFETKDWQKVGKRCIELKNKMPYSYPKNITGTVLVTHDNLTGFIPFVGHVAIVLNSQQVVQAGPFDGVYYGPNNWDTSKVTCYGVIPKGTTAKDCYKATKWAQGQVGKGYNFIFHKWKDTNAKSFYCSQLAWASYFATCGIDIVPDHPKILFPVYLLNNPETTELIYFKDAKYD